MTYNNDNTGLTEIPRIKRQYDYNQEWNFGKGKVREAFQRIFSPNGNYVLFQTIANKEAVEALKQYIGFRKDMNSLWEIRKIHDGDEPTYVPGARDSGNGLKFGNDLMDRYQRAINELAAKKIGQKNYSHYPMVSTHGVHSLDRDPNAIFWPRIYMVNAKKEKSLKKIIDELIGNKSLEILRKNEAPQFYHTAEIETLHKLKIAPIVRLEQELRAGAQDLSKYVDFLAQMTETYKWTGTVIEFD